MLSLLPEILRRAAAAEPVVVCTLVRTRGSTPQKAGAVMVVLRDGQTLGTIGGGCVEAEVRSRALRLIAEPGTRLMTFKLDEDHGWDDGLVCGGTMDVAVETIDAPAGAAGYRAAYDRLTAGEVSEVVVEAEGERFTRTLEPTPQLLIAGAGHVGTALAVVARQVGFDVTVIDDRPDYADAARFPVGVNLRIGDIDRELLGSFIGPATYVVIVTRGHRNDGRALAAVVTSKAKYVGLIGSKRKVLTIFGELLRNGVPRELIERVHAPIGVDVGAVTPGEIAVSIAAELIAARRGVSGPFRVMRVTAELIDKIPS